MKKDLQTNLLSSRGIIYRIYWLPLNANEINGVDNTGFLENFKLLMYLIIFVDFWNYIDKRGKSHCSWKFDLKEEFRRVFSEKFTF